MPHAGSAARSPGLVWLVAAVAGRAQVLVGGGMGREPAALTVSDG
jgi:heptaprenylglyceryl phosphate synthase